MSSSKLPWILSVLQFLLSTFLSFPLSWTLPHSSITFSLLMYPLLDVCGHPAMHELFEQLCLLNYLLPMRSWSRFYHVTAKIWVRESRWCRGSKSPSHFLIPSLASFFFWELNWLMNAPWRVFWGFFYFFFFSQDSGHLLLCIYASEVPAKSEGPYAWKEEQNIWKGSMKELRGLFGTNRLSAWLCNHITMEMWVPAAIAGSGDTLEKNTVKKVQLHGVIWQNEFCI